MRGMTEQIVLVRSEALDKDKRKKRRSKKGSKQISASSGMVCSSVNDILGEASDCLGDVSNPNNLKLSINSFSSQNDGLDSNSANDHGLAGFSNVAFNSLPPMHISGGAALGDLDSMQDRYRFPSDPGGKLHSESCPEQNFHEHTNVSFPNKEFLTSYKNGCYTDFQRKHFLPHWSVEAVYKAMEKGDVFRASFRVNVHNRLEAYCTIDGVPVDVLISGVAAQNRAVEGDIVAIKLDPLAYWTRLKGSAGHFNNAVPVDDCNMFSEVVEVVDDCKRKDNLDADSGNTCRSNDLLHLDMGFHFQVGEAVHPELGVGSKSYTHGPNGHHSSASDPPNMGCFPEQNEASNALANVCSMISSFPSKRPTGRVVAIIEKSIRRDAVVGFLGVKQWLFYREGYKKEATKNGNLMPFSNREYIQLIPTNLKFPKMMVSVKSLPDCIKKRLKEGDATVEMELVAARIGDWKEESLLPQAHVMHIFGRGGEIEPQIAAILFENAICSAEFSPESLSCLPNVPWEVPVEELERRKDLRSFCTFTIDPSTATDLDDALSVERLSSEIFRVGVHIADVSYFVLPDTALDMEAQIRSTSVYLLQHKLPMLPSLLSANLGSLIPGVDRLSFSIIWDINLAGDIVDRWIGHTVIRSCCKLSYQQAQDIIDGLMDARCLSTSVKEYPELHGQFEWHDVIESVKNLHKISKILKENRCKDGALQFESSKLVFLFDEYGIPYDGRLCANTESNFLVEEFMLLANMTAAEVISRAFPDCALLRRHPGPNPRKLREFEAFCTKHGLELDTSSSGQIHLSLGKIREKLKNDPILFDILISYASRPMQSAEYFCTGNFRDGEIDWAHYSLAVPFYTHFTSPLRRYPDIVVHRTLAAALEAEDMYLKLQMMALKPSEEPFIRKCFTSIYFDKDDADSEEGRKALSAAALKHRIPCTEILSDIAAYCNERKLASRHAEDAGYKLYLWALLKKKEFLKSEARVLGLGPKFMSIYIHKLAMERRIYYDEVEGLTTEWLETTSTLVVDLCANKRSHKRGSPGKWRTLEDVAWVVTPCDLKPKQATLERSNHEGGAIEVGANGLESEDSGPIYKPSIADFSEIDPFVFPLTVRLLSTIPVALHAVGGDDGPLDIGARLYMSSYIS